MSCPICSSPTDPKFRPFCSRRCADVDLAKWLSGTYAIPAEPVEDDGFDGEDDPADRPARH